MKTVDYVGNSKVRKFFLGDLAPGEVYYRPGDCWPSKVSSNYASRAEVASQERIEVWTWFNTQYQCKHEWLHKNCEVIPVNVDRVIRRCLREQRKAKLAANAS